jgi:hypothetical protein
MTSSIIHFFLFLAVFIIYIHFHNQNSYPDNLDIYELEFINNHTLQKTCDLKKPFLFEYVGEPFLSQDSVLFTGSNTDADNVSVPFSQLSSFLSSTNNSSSSNYIETDNLLYNSFSPPSSTFAGYNVLCGSQDVCSKVFTHNYYRKFIYVETGSVEIYFLSHQQSISPKIISDYVNFEFSSDSNILSLASEKCTVQAGNIVYIPSNCLYCIVYKDKSNICIDMSYHSIISFLSNIHKIGLYYIQQSNILQTPSNIKKYEPSAPAVLEPDSPVDETIDTIVEDSSGNNTSS